jgi:hypothetical protein
MRFVPVLICLALSSTLCAAADAAPAGDGSRGVAIYLARDLPGAQPPPPLRVLTHRLERAGFHVSELNSSQLSAAGALDIRNTGVLIADLRRLPVAVVPVIERWIRSGGLLVSIAAPAFTEQLQPSAGGWQRWDDYAASELERVGRSARKAVRWAPAEVALCRQTIGGYAKKPALLTSLSKADPDGGDAVEARVPGFAGGWWALAREFGKPVAQAGDALTCFWAHGDGKTNQMSVEWAEQDGSRWIAVVPLGARWRLYTLPPSAFAYWPDNPSNGRGGPGDMLRLDRAVTLQLGFSNSHTPGVFATNPAERRLTVGAIGFAPMSPDVARIVLPPERPDLEALSPGYKLHAIRCAVRWEATDLGRLSGLPARLPAPAAFGAIARPMGSGFGRGRLWRWMPLVQARAASGRVVGVPLSVVLSETDEYRNVLYVSLGLADARALADPGMQNALAATILRLTSAPILFEAGLQHYLLRPGESVRPAFRIVNMTRRAARVRVWLYGISGAGAVFTADAQRVLVGPRREEIVNLAPTSLEPGDWPLTAYMDDGNRTIDEIRQPVTVIAKLTSWPSPRHVVGRLDGALMLAGMPWHPVGLNYWAHYVGGLPGGVYSRSWLAPELYDAALVEPDLAQLERWGVHAVAAVGADLSWGSGADNQAMRDLEDFLWRAYRHHVKVFLFVPGLDPRNPDDEGARRILRLVARHPALMGYDVAWEPSHAWARRSLGPDWRLWLEREYGSLEKAEIALGHALPRNAAGEVDVPNDDWCMNDGPWRAVTAAYRAYMNWQIGAGYRHTVAVIRSVDPVHRIGFRGNTVGALNGFLPVEQPDVLHFVDFAGPEGYDVPAYGAVTSWPILAARGLTARMLSYLSGGKPVIWMEFGLPVYANGAPWSDGMAAVAKERLDYQVAEGRQTYRMQAGAGAWGSFAWWYPGGFRVGENSDCGFVDPSNAPRPVVRELLAAMPEFERSEHWKPNAWLTFRPEANIGGWVGEYLRLRDEYARLASAGRRVGVRTAGAGTTSADCPLVDPAGRPWPGAGPLRYLDSIFERVRIWSGSGAEREIDLPRTCEPVRVPVRSGSLVRLDCRVGNTGEAVWLPVGGPAGGGVRLILSGDASAEADLPARIGFQGSARLELRLRMPDHAIRVTLRLQAGTRAPFGETIELDLEPE